LHMPRLSHANARLRTPQPFIARGRAGLSDWTSEVSTWGPKGRLDGDGRSGNQGGCRGSGDGELVASLADPSGWLLGLRKARKRAPGARSYKFWRPPGPAGKAEIWQGPDAHG